jgi:hypothetical protein
MKILGAVVEREEPRENIQAAFAKYTNLRSELMRRKDTVKPFLNLWPAYQNAEEFGVDFTFSTAASGNQIVMAV